MTRLRNSDRLRTRIFWVLVAFGSAPMLAALLYIDQNWVVGAAVASISASLVLGFVVSGFLVAPIHELARRLSVKNFGDDGDGPPREPRTIDLDQSGAELAAKLSAPFREQVSQFWQRHRCGPERQPQLGSSGFP